MSKKQSRKQKQKEYRKEEQRLKALPKPLRKLETDLGLYVDFMEIYDGYIGDFTGEIIPTKPVKNPFAIIGAMKLNFPHPNALNLEQKEMYVAKISEAFTRIGFNFEIPFFSDENFSDKYELLLFHFDNYEEKVFGSIKTFCKDGITLKIERIDYNHIY